MIKPCVRFCNGFFLGMLDTKKHALDREISQLIISLEKRFISELQNKSFLFQKLILDNRD